MKLLAEDLAKRFIREVTEEAGIDIQIKYKCIHGLGILFLMHNRPDNQFNTTESGIIESSLEKHFGEEYEFNHIFYYHGELFDEDSAYMSDSETLYQPFKYMVDKELW